MTLDLHTVIGVLVLAAIPVAWYLATPPEPEANVEARKRYGKVGEEKIKG